jgi:hypothetical protein
MKRRKKTMAMKDEICDTCKGPLQDLFEDNEEGGQDFKGRVCKDCNLLYIEKQNQYFKCGPREVQDRTEMHPIQMKCRFCEAYIVHPDRTWAICIDCLIQKLLEKKALDISVAQYKRR